MARKIFVSSKMGTDEQLLIVAERHPLAPLLWPWLLTAFDDWGRAEYRPRELKARTFPGFAAVTADAIAEAIDLYAEVGLLLRYAVAGREYMALPLEKWFEYQTHIRREKREHDESRIPPPPPDPPCPPRESAREIAQTRAEARENEPSPSPSPSPTPTADAVAGAPAREDSGGGGELAMVATGTDGADLTALRQRTGVAERLNGRARAGELHVLPAATQRRHLPRAPTDCRFMGAAALNKYELPDNIPRDFQAVVPALESRDVNRLWRRQCQRIRDECGRCAWGTCTDGLAEAQFHLASWAKRQKGKLDNPLTALDHVFRKAAYDVIRAVADETL